MQYFDLEEAMEKVTSKKTKKYLKEVISTYNNKNFRSCIVMLYAITYIDILNKIQMQSDLYKDANANSFLANYNKKRSENAKYSDLERLIFEFAKTKSMLSDVEIRQWEHLKDYRDYCAHPVFNKDYELISPNREQVKAHIRNMCEAIFFKDAIIHGKIFDDFFDSIKSFFDRNSLNLFKDYVNKRYIAHLDIYTKKQFCKNLWKIAFSIQDEECKKYRIIAYRSLIEIINSDKTALIVFFLEEQAFFNGHIFYDNITINIDSKSVFLYEYSSTSMLYLLHSIPELFSVLNSGHIEEFKNLSTKNINYLLFSDFLFENSALHVKAIIQTLSGLNHCLDFNILNKVWKKAASQDDFTYNDLIIHYFINNQNSHFHPDFDYLNETYNGIIKNTIATFTKSQLETLISQLTVGYTDAHCFLNLCVDCKNLITEKQYDIDYSKYNINLNNY